MPTNFLNTYAAGFRNGYIKTADGNSYDIDAIINIEGNPTQEDTEIKGDDTIKTTFSSGRKDEITITANGLSMDVIQALSGNQVSSSSGGAAVAQGTQGEMNPPFVEVGGEINGRTSDGTAVILKKVWHKVQLGKTKINAGNGKEMSIEITGNAYQTDTDITGSSLSTSRVATVSVRPGTL